MAPASMSVSSCDGDTGERQQLLHHDASSSDQTGRKNDDPYFSRREKLAFLVFLLFCAFHFETFLSKPFDEPHETLATTHYSEIEIASCEVGPCFEPSPIHVPLDILGFPSFLRYAHRGPLLVSYDKRSLKLNGDRVFFLGGSMHPARATLQTWNYALDEAVENGLNLITIYVMWADHQPLPNKPIDWTFPDWSSPHEAACHDTTRDKSCEDWSLATAIRSAANRGLFVHLRIGPYDCAEYSYGGIPEWLMLDKPNMKLRRPNREWLEGKCFNHLTVQSRKLTFRFSSF